jgi:pimeloyl-ACP methyl ester carboxylesterase
MEEDPMRAATISCAAVLFACASGSTQSRGGGGSDAPARIQMEEHFVPAKDDGIKLYLRNKHPAGQERFAPDRIVLFVHGSTYPAETSFDLPLSGLSWMDYIAQHGFDVWLVDVRGYGRSTRPKEMDQPAKDNPPIVRTDTAVKDVGAAVEFILRKRGAQKLALLGWSWGTTMMASYTVQNPEKVEKLVLYAPQWLRENPPLFSGEGAYRTVSIDSARDRWLKGVAEDKKASLIPAGWFEQWAEATFATDPVGSKESPKTLRAPNGTLADTKEFWSSGKPVYDPARITVPTLIVHAEWDHDNPTPLARGVFEKLTSAPYKRFVEIGEGTHTIIMEKNRMQLFREVQMFLEEPALPATGGAQSAEHPIEEPALPATGGAQSAEHPTEERESSPLVTATSSR